MLAGVCGSSEGWTARRHSLTITSGDRKASVEYWHAVTHLIALGKSLCFSGLLSFYLDRNSSYLSVEIAVTTTAMCRKSWNCL